MRNENITTWIFERLVILWADTIPDPVTAPKANIVFNRVVKPGGGYNVQHVHDVLTCYNTGRLTKDSWYMVGV